MIKPRILIVDDEPAFIRLLSLVLERTGRYSVRQESEATRAVAVAEDFHPDLIVLDFIMPRTDGLSIAQQLRSDPQFSEVPIIFLSATVLNTTDGNPTIGGFPAYTKPIGVADLLKAIDRHLAAAQCN